MLYRRTAGVCLKNDENNSYMLINFDDLITYFIVLLISTYITKEKI